MYNILPFSSPYIAGLAELLDTTFGIVSTRKIAIIKWKYFSPFAKKQTITYLALTHENRVIGQYTNAPLPVVYKKHIFKSLCCMDMATDKAHRGKGIMRALSEIVDQQSQINTYDFVIGFSNDMGVTIDRTMKNYGYSIVGKFVRYYRVILRKQKTNCVLLETDTFNQICLSKLSSDFIQIKKSKEYLTWRYINKPDSQYSIFQIKNNGILSGYVIVRFINEKVYVFDILSKNNDTQSMKNICRAIENKALESKKKIVIYQVVQNSFWSKIFASPSYLRLLSQPKNHYLTIKFLQKSTKKSTFTDKELWYCMSGDIL